MFASLFIAEFADRDEKQPDRPKKPAKNEHKHVPNIKNKDNWTHLHTDIA